MRTVTIIADDKVGLLADISYILGKAKINIESINVDVVGDKAVVNLALSDNPRGKDVLEASGYRVTENDTIVVKLEDKPGELNRITALLSTEGVSIENVHMLSKDGRNTILALRVNKPKRASTLLKEFSLGREEPEI